MARLSPSPVSTEQGSGAAEGEGGVGEGEGGFGLSSTPQMALLLVAG